MSRVSQKTILFSWLISISVAGIIGFLSIVVIYVPFLEHTFAPLNPDAPVDTILKLKAVSLLNLDVLNFQLNIDIMDVTWLALLLLFILPAYYYRKDHKWRKKIDSYLPYLLREIADAQKVGLPLPRAILEASKRQYGPFLPPENSASH